jgi:formylglycine-generating enzyme required for sulfatase activity
MGSPDSEQDRERDEGPQTLVTLTRGFWMGRYEVTQGEYLAVMESNPSYFTGDTNRPVENVSWNDATNYCAKLTVRERAAGRLPAGWEYRLPTEAQWEYACRAGSTNRFHYGDDPGYTELANYAWYTINTGSTQAVGGKLPNQWGLYDMHGNV